MGRLVAIISVAAGIVFGVVWAYQDYNDWVRLGPGGLPHSLKGWGQVSLYRLAKADPLDTSVFDDAIGAETDISKLHDLRPRAGERPVIARHPVPHRQLNQHGDAFVQAQLMRAFQSVVAAHSHDLVFRTSYFEKHNDAIWIKGRTDLGEIAHVHPSDGTLHVVLSPSDTLRVLNAQRGELHPLVGKGGLSKTYTLLYAPMTEDDVDAIGLILEAAVAYAFQRQNLLMFPVPARTTALFSGACDANHG